MKLPTYAAATFLALSAAGAAFAQSPTRTPETGNSCAMDYTCNPPPKGKGIGRDNAVDSDEANAARVRTEALPPRSSNEPEEPEQAVGQPVEPEGPISNSH